MPRNSKPVPTENPVTARLRGGKEGRKRAGARQKEKEGLGGCQRESKSETSCNTCVPCAVYVDIEPHA